MRLSPSPQATQRQIPGFPEISTYGAYKAVAVDSSKPIPNIDHQLDLLVILIQECAKF